MGRTSTCGCSRPVTGAKRSGRADGGGSSALLLHSRRREREPGSSCAGRQRGLARAALTPWRARWRLLTPSGPLLWAASRVAEDRADARESERSATMAKVTVMATRARAWQQRPTADHNEGGRGQSQAPS
eukprot:scaffold85724_cov63-Phaeocystis_antarctica.AAC.3